MLARAKIKGIDGGQHMSRAVCLQTVVLDYVQSEIHLKSSRDKSQLDLASELHRTAPAMHHVLALLTCMGCLVRRMAT